jgi:anaerobic carbon-monoxide dehydrogenase iron sulfur subunit
VKEQSQILVRLDRCVGCHSCELACAVAHSDSGILYDAITQDRRPQRRIFVEAAVGIKAPMLCRHCEDAPCARACPSGALSFERASGVVRYQSLRCLGCFLCVLACPMGMIQQDQDLKHIVKCDRCAHLELPACVSACPTRALRWQTTSEFTAIRRHEISRQMLIAVDTGRPARSAPS